MEDRVKFPACLVIKPEYRADVKAKVRFIFPVQLPDDSQWSISFVPWTDAAEDGNCMAWASPLVKDALIPAFVGCRILIGADDLGTAWFYPHQAIPGLAV